MAAREYSASWARASTTARRRRRLWRGRAHVPSARAPVVSKGTTRRRSVPADAHVLVGHHHERAGKRSRSCAARTPRSASTTAGGCWSGSRSSTTPGCLPGGCATVECDVGPIAPRAGDHAARRRTEPTECVLPGTVRVDEGTSVKPAFDNQLVAEGPMPWPIG